MTRNATAIGALCAILLTVAVKAEEPQKGEDRPAWMPSLELSIDRSSRYISEGNVGNPDPIYTIDLSAEWSVTDDFSVHLGGIAIMDETDACDNKGNVEEWDWKAGFTYTIQDIPGIGPLELNFDYIYYNYPRDKAHTHDTDTKEYEIDITATELFLSPGIVFVHDFENDVIKANVNVTIEQELSFISEDLSFECPVELWCGNHQYTGSTRHTAVYSLCTQPTLKYKINDNFSIGTYVLLAWGLDPSVRRDWKEDPNNNAFNTCWGLNLTASF